MAMVVGKAPTESLGEVEDNESWVRGGDGAQNTSLNGWVVPRLPARSVEGGIWGDRGCGIVVALSNSDKLER